VDTSLQQHRAAINLADVLPIVDRVVAQMSCHLPSHISAQDLASAGKEALIEILRDYGSSADVTRYYCVSRVRGAVLDELRRLDPLSRTSRVQVKRVRKAVAELELKLGRVPSDNEVARESHLSIDVVRKTEQLGLAAEAVSFDAPSVTGSDVFNVTDPNALSPADVAEGQDVYIAVQSALSRIPEKQALVLRRYHFEGATLDTIARDLGVSIQRVQQLRQAGEKKLRADFAVLAIWQNLFDSNSA
jgi:RNA polymerase sigma factor for flagellar operon FliA